MINFFKSKTGFIIMLALIVRLLFLVYGTSFYFNRPDFKVDGDTGAWQHMFENFYNYGEFRTDYVSNNSDFVWYSRMPGYSFFMGTFWLLFNQNKDVAYWCVVILQLLLDVVAAALLYHAVLAWFKNQRIALITGLLYTLYPFIIVWNVVVYSESISIFLLIFSLYLYTKNDSQKNKFFSAFLIGLAVLFRPQILVFIPFFAIGILWRNHKLYYKPFAIYCLGIMLSYGIWPLRNAALHHKIVLSQDIQSLECWQPDVLAFMHYTYVVKAEWEPQFSNIIKNEEVKYPAICYQNTEDSAMLEQAIYLAKNQGAGFSQWRGYWKQPISVPNANLQIYTLFTNLRIRFIKQNPMHVYLYVPLQNLKKAIFKLELSKKNNGIIGLLTSLLFMYRTLLILLGFTGCFLLMKQHIPTGFILFFSVASIYLFLCFGTGSQFRNIEIRYFLPADVLLIIPASYFLNWLLEKYFLRLKS
jgi:4-amino-4-deoxy-L-arabinose transferase-like glycosyltransferase